MLPCRAFRRIGDNPMTYIKAEHGVRIEQKQMTGTFVVITAVLPYDWSPCHPLPHITCGPCYMTFTPVSLMFISVQSLSHVRLFATPWTAASQASLSITNSWSLFKLMSIESVMPTNHLLLCRPVFLLHSFFSSIRIFSKESVLCIRWPKYWSFKL